MDDHNYYLLDVLVFIKVLLNIYMFEHNKNEMINTTII